MTKTNRRWYAVDYNGDEYIYNNKPIRGISLLDSAIWKCPRSGTVYWRLEPGTIERITGKRMTWEDEPLEWWDGKEREETPQPAPQDLRERAEVVFDANCVSLYTMGTKSSSPVSAVPRSKFVDAMLQFHSEVSADKDREIAKLKAELQEILNYGAYRFIKRKRLEAYDRIAELEAEVKRLNDAFDNYVSQNIP